MQEIEEIESHHVSARKRGKPLGPNHRHYPNKSERKELARLCQKSGLTKNELMKSKTARQKLAAAQHEPMVGRGHHRRFTYLLKQAKRRIAAQLGGSNIPPKCSRGVARS